MPRYFLEIAYDGSPYRGWQRQPAVRTVQAEVELALRTRLQQRQVHAIGCGRTDTGVHATSYYLHFDAPEPIANGPGFVASMNAMLPDSIAAYRLIRVADDAHARFAAMEREYSYLIHRHKDPFLHGRSLLMPIALDLVAMQEAARMLPGRKDFSCFQRTGSDSRTPICEVRAATWEATPTGYRFTITADRYLRNMVRAIVGTCIRIGRGSWPAAYMAEVLASKDRSMAGKSAPACGLYLTGVRYPFITPEEP